VPMSFVIEFLTRLAGLPIISIDRNEVSVVIIRYGQIVHIGIIVMVEVGSINFSIYVVKNFGAGF
jgi:hypothetical protein